MNWWISTKFCVFMRSKLFACWVIFHDFFTLTLLFRKNVLSEIISECLNCLDSDQARQNVSKLFAKVSRKWQNSLLSGVMELWPLFCICWISWQSMDGFQTNFAYGLLAQDFVWNSHSLSSICLPKSFGPWLSLIFQLCLFNFIIVAEGYMQGQRRVICSQQ